MPILDQNAIATRTNALALALSLALAGTAATMAADANAAAAAPLSFRNPTHTPYAPPRTGKHPKKGIDLAHLRMAAENVLHSLPQPHPVSRAATTVRISSANDTGTGSLRAALENAVDGDVIDLREMRGKIALSSTLTANARVTIQGPGRDLLTLDGGGAHRVLASSHALVVSNITLANGAVPAGASTAVGGCLLVTGNLSLSHATLDNCHAIGSDFAYGGAVAVVDGAAQIRYSTITNSSAEALKIAIGGAVLAGGATGAGRYGVTLAYSTISGNSVIAGYQAYGGGVAGAYGNTADKVAPVMILASTISGNTATATSVPSNYANGTTYYYGFAVGAGVWTSGSNLTLTASTISGNTTTCNASADGGGVYTHEGSYYNPTTMAYESLGGDAGVYGSRVADNTLTSIYLRSYGGGMEVRGKATIVSSTLSGNVAQSMCTKCYAQGGGLFLGKYSPGATITASTFSGNNATGTGTDVFAGGGAISTKYSNHDTSITLTNSTLSGNTASAPNTSAAAVGGAIYQAATGYLGTITANNSTIAFNTAATAGGGLALGEDAAVTFNSTIVAGNSSTANPGTSDFAGPGAPTVAGDNNLVQVDPSPGVTLTGANNIVGQDPLLQPLALNGGPTQTHALGTGSPAIDTGNNLLTLVYDQRGAPYAREVPAGSPDIGAYELDPDRIFANGFE